MVTLRFRIVLDHFGGLYYGFGSFWIVLLGCGWFRIVLCFNKYDLS